MTAVQLDERCWPLVLAVFPDRAMTDDEWAQFLDTLDGYQKRSGSLLLVFDMPGIKHLPNAKQRALIAEKSPDGGAFGAEAFVATPSAVVRGVGKAIGWLSRQDQKIEYFPDLAAAVRAAAARARKLGTQLAADPADLLRDRAKSA